MSPSDASLILIWHETWDDVYVTRRARAVAAAIGDNAGDAVPSRGLHHADSSVRRDSVLYARRLYVVDFRHSTLRIMELGFPSGLLLSDRAHSARPSPESRY
jgi:hypothetical protein